MGRDRHRREYQVFKTIKSGLVALGLFVAALTTAAPAHAEWLKAETEHFIIYGDWSEASIRRYAQRIERYDALLRTYYPITTDHQIPKLEIYLANGGRDMNRVSPGISGSVAGFYSPNNGRIYAVVNTNAMSGDVVMFHEYAHHFMFQMGANAYPSWFVEGFAEYYATADVKEGELELGRHHPGRMNALNIGFNSWAKMEDVLTWRISRSGRAPIFLYYAQSWAMAHYFLSSPERTRMLGQYLNAVKSGQPSVAAMQAATGRTPNQLQDDIWRYMSGRITLLTPQIELPVPDVTVTRLSRTESDAIWLDIRLDTTPVTVEKFDNDGQREVRASEIAKYEREQAEERAELIRSSMTLAQRLGDDRIGLLLAARAHRINQRPDLALETLLPKLDDTSTDGDMLRVAAEALLDQAKAETDPQAAAALRRRASGFLARAMDATPLDFRVYVGLNDTRRGQARYPTDNDISTLEVANALAPQSFEVRLRLGEAYIARTLYAQAIQTLTPVSNSPHRSAYTRRAREMINQAHAALGQATEDFGETPTDEEPSSTPEAAGAH